MEIKLFLLLPVYALLFLLLGMQLLQIAESASAKTVAFASDMENAIDCATHALPLEECSPGIFSHNFKPEINGTINKTEEFLSILQSKINITINSSSNETGNATIVIIINQ